MPGAVVRSLASHQRGPGSIPRSGVICGLSLLLVLSLSPMVFSRLERRLSSLHKTSISYSNSIWNQWTNSHSVDAPLQIPINLFYFIYHLFVFVFIAIFFLSFACSALTRYCACVVNKLNLCESVADRTLVPRVFVPLDQRP